MGSQSGDLGGVAHVVGLRCREQDCEGGLGVKCDRCGKELDSDDMYCIEITENEITVGHWGGDDCDRVWVYNR